ncbi:MAG: UDP-N-acetylmuramoyl-tripeptide--D-alanyl-D-alanine ligase, partial [Brooklawnia sp.]
ITGSAGKTSTKDLLAQLLAAHGATMAPVGSYNNELGTPLTVCQVDDQTRYLVSEMGSRAKGDIAHLCSIVQPDASIVVNVGSAHLGEFGSQQAIAAAKGEIIQALQPDGWAVLNADDRLVDAMAADTDARIARFTVGPRPISADLVVRAEDLVPDELDRFAFNLTASRGTDQQQARIQLGLLGRHQVTNAAAAATAALAVGLRFDLVAQVLNQATVRSPWRMELHELPSGAALINDAYNANPDSMAAALRTLAAIGDRRRASQPRARITAVLGDMLELGPQSPELHRQVGELAANLDIDEVIAIGQYAADLAAGAVQAGGQGRAASAESVAESLELASGDVVLVKASRGLRLERVADALVGGEVDK